VNDSQPVFQQIMDLIETDIITGVYGTDDLIISTTQIAKLYGVNPTTAMKAVGKLTDAGVLYKKRGIGMCVAPGAHDQILARRRETFRNRTVPDLVAEASALGITRADLIDTINRAQHDAAQKDTLS
jgi:DNA-binding transcriptional regulator YhcF (GntR family)